MGDVTETIDGDGKDTFSYYDQQGRLTVSIDPDGKTSYNYYDAAGQ